MDLGLHRAGFDFAFQCERDAYRRAVLAERFPGVPCFPDVREVAEGARSGRLREVGGDGGGSDDGVAWRVVAAGLDVGRGGRLDIACGGFPCQDVSVAGRRAGLDGERSGLFFDFARFARAVRPRTLLIENVPGLFTSNHGRDFATIIDTLDALGYVGGWRVFDSRMFGVPQRRERVFILAADAALDPGAERVREVLGVGYSCERHPASSAEAGEDVASAAGEGAGDGGWEELTVSPPVTAKWAKGSGGPAGDEAQNLVAFQCQGTNVGPMGALRSGNGHVTGGVPCIAATLSGGGHPNSNVPGRRKEDDVNLVAFHMTQDPIQSSEVSPAFGKGNSQGCASVGVAMDGEAGLAVRRLTPRECERLQGLPDDWTDVPYVDARGKVRGAVDTRRYGAVGDAVTATVAEWLGRRIAGMLATLPGEGKE